MVTLRVRSVVWQWIHNPLSPLYLWNVDKWKGKSESTLKQENISECLKVAAVICTINHRVILHIRHPPHLHAAWSASPAHIRAGDKPFLRSSLRLSGTRLFECILHVNVLFSCGLSVCFWQMHCRLWCWNASPVLMTRVVGSPWICLV